MGILSQESLGGNSKTMVIANVSPSIRWVPSSKMEYLESFFKDDVFSDFYSRSVSSCVNETLSTLKFAQRAKLIQNNVRCLRLPA